MNDVVLQVNDLKKSYKKNEVLKSVSMTIRKGDIYGFVGKNGAGKTTLIRIISGIAKENGGSFELFGIKNTSKKINKARRKVCVMVESPSIYPELSAKDNLKMQCYITKQNISCVNELLSFVNLSFTGNKKAKDFSLGMRQRLGIAMALVNKPELMLLDEPINGLDPEGIKQIRDLLIKMHDERNVTILISSHILSELSLLANRYGFIDKGTIIKEATLEEISEAEKENCIIESNNIHVAREILEKLGYPTELKDNKLYLDCDVDLMQVVPEFQNKGIKLTKHICNNIDLEKYFMDLIGE